MRYPVHSTPFLNAQGRIPTWWITLLVMLLASPVLKAETLVIDTLGIQFEAPDGARITSRNQPGQPPFILLRDGQERPRWSLRLERLESDEATAFDLLIELLARQQEVGSETEPAYQAQLPIGKDLAEIAWTLRDAGEGQQLAFGTLVLGVGEGNWLVGSAVAMPRDLETVRVTLQPLFSSIQVQDPTLMILDREAAMSRGRELMAGITEPDLRELVGYKQLRRVHQPGGLSDTEIGYSLIEVMTAPRGAIKRHRNPERYSKNEKEEGLLVKEHGRYVLDANRDSYIDILSLQWLSWDMEREAWYIIATRRQGEAHTTETEIGFRTEATLGNPRPVLHVIKEDAEINMRQPYEWKVPEGWLPRPLSNLLAKLVPDEPSTYGFITYDPSGNTPSITTRVDTWKRDTTTRGRMTLESRIGQQGLPSRSSYGRDGILLRLVKPNGSIIEAATRKEILKRWTDAGLSIE